MIMHPRARARCFDVIAPILINVHYVHRVQRDKTSKYRLETKLISARGSFEIIATMITEYRVEMELNVNRRAGKQRRDPE